MGTKNMPGFTAEVSLYHTIGQYHTSQVSTAATQLVVRQLKWCPPRGLCDKASNLCRDPMRGGYWCDILSRCDDCRPDPQT